MDPRIMATPAGLAPSGSMNPLSPVCPVAPVYNMVPPSVQAQVRHRVQRDSDARFDAHTMREVFDTPCSRWAAIAAIPEIAAALAAFPSEMQTRPKGRLDLVSWVAAVSAFGVDGPSDRDWRALFVACCFTVSDGAPLHLSEAQIAVLLAHAKCTEDVPADKNFTDHVLVKMRIRPAVEGRNEARAPGILLQVQRKYDEFLYSLLPDYLLQQSVGEADPVTLFPAGWNPSTAAGFGGGCDMFMASTVTGFSDSSVESVYKSTTCGEDGNSSGSGRDGSVWRSASEDIRSVTDQYVDERVAQWEAVMRDWLRLDLTKLPQDSARVARFIKEREDYRSHLRASVCNKVALHLLDRHLGCFS